MQENESALLEIEEVLIQHPDVSEVAVTGTPDPMLGEIVHAFIVPEGPLEESELRAFCVKKLSHHKIPRRYTFLEDNPKECNRKSAKAFIEGKRRWKMKKKNKYGNS